MNQEFNMKKLTALLLGTVISIAFTTDEFADPLSGARDVAKKYFTSDDGATGGYLGVAYIVHVEHICMHGCSHWQVV